MPTVALVDAGGTLRWIDVHPDYTTRTEPTDVLAAVRTRSRDRRRDQLTRDRPVPTVIYSHVPEPAKLPNPA